MKLILKSFLLATLAVAVTGVLPMPVHAGQEQLAAKISETSLQVYGTRDQLQTTMDSLSVLVAQQGGDLKPAFEKFQTEVAKTVASAEATKATATAMQKQGAAYFGDWEREIAGISNEKLRKSLEKRMKAVKSNYADATKALEAAGEKFKPFLSDLTDVEKFLAHDLTAGGIKSVKGTVSSAKFNLGKIRRSIQTATDSLDDMSARLKPDAK